MQDVIVNLCPTGMIPTKEITPHVPISPNEIIEDVLACAEVGVTMVHAHARDKNGKPDYNPEIYAEILQGIRKHRPDLIVGISLSGRDFKEFEKRSAGLFNKGEARPDTGSLTTSSLNFPKQASVNDPEMIKNLAQTMLEKGILPELEVFDTGMINYVKYLIKKELIKPPYYLNLLFGNIANAQADEQEAKLMLQRLPENSFWSFAGIGDCQLEMNTLAIEWGGGVRVGLEDNIYFDPSRTKLATNLEMIKRIKQIAETNNRRIMDPLELRKKLHLHTEKGMYCIIKD